MALGLFAIFSILRFSTVTFSVKDMTYIFIVIGISVINSQANIAPSVIGAVAINSIILVATYSLEIFYKKNVQNSLILVYNKPELLVPSQKKELLNDLSILTGQDIIKVVIHKINTSTGSSEVEVFFRDTAIK